ncbi:MAG: NYN domain-containing protein, partial [Clostridia bacterium]|nr:NYN domain-containing protein [Clostridia bacterium]
ELLAVFEKTYGPIRRREYEVQSPIKRPLDPTPKYKPAKQVQQGPEYLLVDGYNIIFAWDDLKKIAAESLEAAREHLIDRLCNYQGFTQCELIVVFDAYKVKNNPGEVEKIHHITVVYTKEAETADMYIEKATKQLGKHHKVRVATSDNLEQLIIIGHGALRISADAFLEEVKIAENSIRAILEETKERGI